MSKIIEKLIKSIIIILIIIITITSCVCLYNMKVELLEQKRLKCHLYVKYMIDKNNRKKNNEKGE
jgi:hypothetical protein